MKNIKEADRIVRNKLRNHVVEMPNHLWEKIEAKRAVGAKVNHKKSSNSKWLLLLLLLFLFGTATGVWLNLDSDENKTKLGQDDAMTILPSTVKKERKKTATLTTKKQSKLILTENKEEVSNKKEISLKQNKLVKTNNSQIVQTNNSLSQKTAAKANTNNRQFSIYEPVANATSNESGIESMPNNTATSAKTAKTKTELGEENANIAKVFLKNISYMPNEFTSLQANPLPLGSLPDPKCAKFGNSSFGFDAYLDWYVSPDYAFRNLEATDAEYLDDAKQRDKTESFLYAYSTGIRLSAVADNGLAFRTGIAYSQINEKFDYVNGNETNISIKNVLDPDGNIISSDTIIQIGTRVKNIYNRYRMIDIPLILGYEVESKHFIYSLNAGVYLNLLFTQKGDFLQGNRAVNFTSNRIDSYKAFKDKLGLSLYGSFGFNYKLSNRMQILIEPHIRYHLNPINNKDYKINQRYITTGLITGIRFRF